MIMLLLELHPFMVGYLLPSLIIFWLFMIISRLHPECDSIDKMSIGDVWSGIGFGVVYPIGFVVIAIVTIHGFFKYIFPKLLKLSLKKVW